MARMKTRTFGLTGRLVGEVGLGTWQIGGNWGEVSEDVALATLSAAVEAGTSLFDTADVYGDGRSERLIGRFLKQNRSPLYVATKLGRSGSPGWPKNFEREAIRAHTEASLQRLGVETLDLTQLHCVPFEVLQRGEVFESLRELKREGKIRDFGVSVESMEEAQFCVRQEGVAALQIIFNIFRQKPITTLFDEAQTRKIALLIRLPLASGLLGGKMTRDTVSRRAITETSIVMARLSMSVKPSRAFRLRRASSWLKNSRNSCHPECRWRKCRCDGAWISTPSPRSFQARKTRSRRRPTCALHRSRR